MRRRVLAAMLSLSLVSGGALADTARASQAEWTTALSGTADGTGSAQVTLDAAQSTVCYELTVTLSPPATAAHIHRGAAGSSGPVVVPFEAPSTGTSSGCVQGVDAALLDEITQNPAGFYVNIHNSQFPAGAIRGQLAE